VGRPGLFSRDGFLFTGEPPFPELRGGFCHDCQSDPFARGAYSYAGVGGRGAGTELAVPVDSTLFFAGEATQSDGRNATVHGAISSGQRAAKQVLAALGGSRST
jgi:monoamine oxidase